MAPNSVFGSDVLVSNSARMAISTEMCGILLMIASGICVTSDMVTSRLIKESGWPYWYLVSGTCLVATLANGFCMYLAGTAWPKMTEAQTALGRFRISQAFRGHEVGPVASSFGIVALALHHLGRDCWRSSRGCRGTYEPLRLKKRQW